MGSTNGTTQIGSENRAGSSASVSYRGKNYDLIREGLADVLTPQQIPPTKAVSDSTQPKKKTEERPQTVFYNPIQQYNRDLSVLAIKAFAEDLIFVTDSKKRRKEQQRGKKRKRDADDGPAAKDAGQDAHDSGTTTAGKDEEPTAPTAAVPPIQQAQDSVQGDKTTSEDQKEASVEAKLNGIEQNPDPSVEAQTKPRTSNNETRAPFRILDALSATGLRALRYAKEIPAVTSVTANDLLVSATDAIKLNVSYNGLEGKVVTTTSDAAKHMYLAGSHLPGSSSSYHVIDLDPYGTAAPFLDAAVQAVADGGLLCVTCTDASVFASTGYLEKTFSQYGGLPLKGPHAHEAGLRLVLHTIATSAARYGMTIEPLLSLSIDYYVRVWVRVTRSPAEVKFLASKTMIVYNCDSGCGAWETQFFAQAKAREARNGDVVYKFTCALGPSAGKECSHCGFKTHLAGPMWGGPLHNPFFVKKILEMLPTLDATVYKTIPRIEGMLSTVLEESLDDPIARQSDQPQALADDKNTSTNTSMQRPVPPLPPQSRSLHPFFIHAPYLARALNTPTPSDAQLRGALRHLGYRTSRSHTKAGSIVTDAPWTVIWEIMREWARTQNKGRPPQMKDNTAGAGIMSKDRSRSPIESAKQILQNQLVAVPGQMDIAGLDAAWAQLKAALASDTNATVADGADDAAAGRVSDSRPVHELEIKFDEQLGREPSPMAGRKKKMVRYQSNPANWGPMGRAKGL